MYVPSDILTIYEYITRRVTPTPPQERIYSQGDESEYFYVLLSGLVLATVQVIAAPRLSMDTAIEASTHPSEKSVNGAPVTVVLVALVVRGKVRMLGTL